MVSLLNRWCRCAISAQLNVIMLRQDITNLPSLVPVDNTIHTGLSAFLGSLGLWTKELLRKLYWTGNTARVLRHPDPTLVLHPPVDLSPGDKGEGQVVPQKQGYVDGGPYKSP